MATLVSVQIRDAADQVVHHCGYPSAVLSGLAPDSRHLARGGYHVSVDDLWAHGNGADYSNTRANDRGFNPHYGAAMDVSLGTTDMVRAYGRVHAVWADRTDPRGEFINAINCWDGTGDATRFDFDKRTSGYASPDHQWHTHSEWHRRFVLNPKAARAMVSVYAGESKSEWVTREEPAPPVPPKSGVKMLPITGVLPELKQGMKDPVNGIGMVARVQLLLRLDADGVFGAKTAAAVAAYAKQAGHPGSGGTVDAATWRSLYGITGN